MQAIGNKLNKNSVELCPKIFMQQFFLNYLILINTLQYQLQQTYVIFNK